MTKTVSGSLEKEGAAALCLLEQALALLDRFDAPAEIGAHVDLAIERLREALAKTVPVRSRPKLRE